MFETLETRRMLAVSVTKVYGTLTINGDRKDNLITVVENNHNVRVETSTLPDGAITVRNFTGVYKIRINGAGDQMNGDVIFYQGNTVGAVIHGDVEGYGNHWSGGSSGGSGWYKNNWKGHCGGSNGGSTGGSGGETLGGGDFITVTDEGSGQSTVDGDQGNDAITVITGSACGNGTIVYGGTGNDAIYLNTGVGVYNTGAAKTKVWAEAGNDTITVYDGTNYINGGSGVDTVIDFGGTNTVVSASIIEF